MKNSASGLESKRQQVAALLYDGVLNAQDWYAGLDAMRDALGAGFFNFFTLGSGGAGVLDSVDNLGQVGALADKLRDYQEHLIDSDIRMQVLMGMPLGEVMCDHERISARDIARHPVYADFLRPAGFQYTVGALVRDDNGVRDFFGLIRPSDHKQYGSREKQFIQQLMPSLMGSARLRAHMATLSRQASLGLAALDSLSQGIVLLDAQARIHYANTAAERLIQAPSALGTAQGRLLCRSPALQARMQQLLAQACASPAQAGAFDAQMGASQATRLVVTVLPLKASHALSNNWQKPLALVVLVVPGAISALDHRVVCDMLGLSPSEARLLLLLVAGKSVKDFAAVEGCSWHTARSHLKNLMRKTGCHRQLELVQLLQALQLG